MPKPIGRVIAKREAIRAIKRYLDQPDVDGRMIACLLSMIPQTLTSSNSNSSPGKDSLFVTFEYHSGSDTITFKELLPSETVTSLPINEVAKENE